MIFRTVTGVKGQKMAQHDKKFCLSHFISQIPCIIWLSFMVYMCNNDISWKNPVLRNNSIHISGTIIHHTIFIISKFHFFFFFWFSGLLGGKMAKNGPKWQKNVSHPISQEPHLIWMWFLACMCKMIYPAFSLFHVFKFLIFRAFRAFTL